MTVPCSCGRSTLLIVRSRCRSARRTETSSVSGPPWTSSNLTAVAEDDTDITAARMVGQPCLDADLDDIRLRPSPSSQHRLTVEVPQRLRVMLTARRCVSGWMSEVWTANSAQPCPGPRRIGWRNSPENPLSNRRSAFPYTRESHGGRAIRRSIWIRLSSKSRSLQRLKYQLGVRIAE